MSVEILLVRLYYVRTRVACGPYYYGHVLLLYGVLLRDVVVVLHGRHRLHLHLYVLLHYCVLLRDVVLFCRHRHRHRHHGLHDLGGSLKEVSQ